ALRDHQLLVVADAVETHPPLLDLALVVLELLFELTATAVGVAHLDAGGLHLLTLGGESFLKLRGLALELRELELTLAVPPIDFLQTGEDLNQAFLTRAPC